MISDLDRVWLVTGCSSGFGRAIAESVLEAGGRVALTARDIEGLEALVQFYPDRARAFVLDVTNPAQAKQVVSDAVAEFGRLDVLVNNAGFGLLAAMEETTDDQMRRNIETNFVGPLNLIRAALPTLKAQGSGHIINMGAVAGFANEVGFSIYGGAKAALDAASESLRGELAPLGIKVTVVIPGPFRTDFIGRSLEQSERMPEYAPTVGRFATLLSRIDGQQTGDPARAATAIMQVVDDPTPPFRLVLGNYAVDKVAKKLDSVRAELSAWESVGRAADFPKRGV
jgi:NAD(P)-dependent dehydrogenase (short-subunit alcohol dehydrogenase family)